jgi:hypothetical protein
MTKQFDARRAAKTAGMAAVVIALVAMTNNTASFAKTFRQQHPRRAEVLRRDNRLNNQLNNKYGHLDGNYGKLTHEDHSIMRQEQRDARINGGYITKGQQAQLNREENHLERQIDRSQGQAPD